MDVYVVVIKDTHFGVEVEVFDNEYRALAMAVTYLHSQGSQPQELNESMKSGGWLLYSQYSPDSSLYVQKRPMRSA